MKRKKFGHLHYKRFGLVCKTYFWWTDKLLLEIQRLGKHILFRIIIHLYYHKKVAKKEITNSRKQKSMTISWNHLAEARLFNAIQRHTFLSYTSCQFTPAKKLWRMISFASSGPPPSLKRVGEKNSTY